MFSSKRVPLPSPMGKRLMRLLGLAVVLVLGATSQAALTQSSQIGVYDHSYALVVGINSYAGPWQTRASAISAAPTEWSNVSGWLVSLLAGALP